MYLHTTDDLSGSDLKERFFEYLVEHHSESQVVVVENQHPPDLVEGRCNLVVFTKNPHEGRYGFFPVPS